MVFLKNLSNIPTNVLRDGQKLYEERKVTLVLYNTEKNEYKTKVADQNEIFDVHLIFDNKGILKEKNCSCNAKSICSHIIASIYLISEKFNKEKLTNNKINLQNEMNFIFDVNLEKVYMAQLIKILDSSEINEDDKINFILKLLEEFVFEKTNINNYYKVQINKKFALFKTKLSEYGDLLKKAFQAIESRDSKLKLYFIFSTFEDFQKAANEKIREELLNSKTNRFHSFLIDNYFYSFLDLNKHLEKSTLSLLFLLISIFYFKKIPSCKIFIDNSMFDINDEEDAKLFYSIVSLGISSKSPFLNLDDYPDTIHAKDLASQYAIYLHLLDYLEENKIKSIINVLTLNKIYSGLPFIKQYIDENYNKDFLIKSLIDRDFGNFEKFNLYELLYIYYLLKDDEQKQLLFIVLEKLLLEKINSKSFDETFFRGLLLLSEEKGKVNNILNDLKVYKELENNKEYFSYFFNILKKNNMLEGKGFKPYVYKK